MTEIVFTVLGLIVGFFIGISADLWGAVRAKRIYDNTIALKNKHIDDLLMANKEEIVTEYKQRVVGTPEIRITEDIDK